MSNRRRKRRAGLFEFYHNSFFQEQTFLLRSEGLSVTKMAGLDIGFCNVENCHKSIATQGQIRQFERILRRKASRMNEPGVNLARFFSWARERALAELEKRLTADPKLDPNWTFSDIMQELLTEYRQLDANSGEPSQLL